jgi:hypothetical protein
MTEMGPSRSSEQELSSSDFDAQMKQAVKHFEEELGMKVLSALSPVPLLSPQLESSSEVSKTIISVSGGALVATISVVQFLAEKIQDPRFPALLPISWLLFGLSIFLAIYMQYAIGRFRSLIYHVTEARLKVFNQKKNGKLEDENQFDEELNRVTLTAMKSLDVDYKFSSILAFSSFVAAFTALIAFAIINIPF